MLDLRPLACQPTRAELREHRRDREGLHPRVRVRPCFGGVSYTALMVLFAAVTLGLRAWGAPTRLVVVGVALSAGSAIAAALCARGTRLRTFVREYRLAAVAASNGLRYERGAAAPSVPGLRYSDSPGRALRRFRGEIGGVAVEVGNYRRADGRVSGYTLIDGEASVVEPFDFTTVDDWLRVSDAVTPRADAGSS
ncbi:hypothetical protein [Herbiconiux sp. A18JL235]|uniref:Uncharacterized protein n=1 Tax=Herbiconiux sp. A18JL235 TaxID=3152363 RepID=A0AB39BF62_9MICO